MAVRAADGAAIASGDVRQVVGEGHITSWLIFHYNDGSLDSDETVFTQHGRFRLVSDHHIQKGPSFPHPMDLTVDVPSGNVTSITGEGAKKKMVTQHMNLPANISNGMVLTALKDLSPSTAETDLSFVAGGSSLRIVQLAITPDGEETFWVGKEPRKARRWLIKIKIGGVAGVVAPLVGKAAADSHAWFAEGVPPMMLRIDGQIYEGGPIWSVELAEPMWHEGGDAQK